MNNISNNQLINFPHLEQLNTPFGRFYQTPDGERYPSATTIIGAMSDRSWLDNWKNKIGHLAAEKITKQAGNRGNKIHYLCEQYLLKNSLNLTKETPFSKHLFLQLKPYLNEIHNVKALEARIFSKKHKISGTVDCVGYYNNNLSIIDFKTSIQFKEISDIDGYFIQCAMYALMWKYLTNEICSKIVVMIAIENSSNPAIYVQNTFDWIKPAKKMIDDYYRKIENLGEINI